MTTAFIITAATVLSTLNHVSGTQSNSQYFYNADFQNGKVSQVNVLNNMTLSRWNQATQSYELAERYEYTRMMDNVVALTKEKFEVSDKTSSKVGDGKKDVAISTEKVLLLSPGNDLVQAARIFE